MNGYNYSVRPLSLHLFCWNLTQHHRPRPVVLSVSLKTIGCLCKDSIMMLIIIIIIRKQHTTTQQQQQQQQHVI
jgi:hypothetical protein